MEISDTQVIAYVDDELPEAERAAIEAAATADPALAARIARHAALRGRLSGAFAGALDEPTPDRLVALIAGSGAEKTPSAADNVVDLARVRSLRASPTPRPRPVWLAWGALAACLVVGAVMVQGRLSPDRRR
jgi:anti-sigma factor RsiW